ncbi:outer membrane protein Iml2/Tetratricopeptide repeat protein 39, partial [Parasitella parasitica]
MFRHLSKITATTIKYTASLFLQCDNSITSESVEIGLQDVQTGLDAMLDDRILEAEDTFSLNKASPFHAFGYALLIYTKAMLSMEKSKFEEAVDCVSSLQSHIKRILSKKRYKANDCSKSIASSCSVPLDSQFDKHKPVVYDEEYLELQFELLYANCILMLATLQFMRDSWIDHVKAAYDLRKAYKIFERIFETLTGSTVLDYQAPSLPNSATQHMKTTKRSASCNDSIVLLQSTPVSHQTVEHGAYFGIGLFHMIFFLLPSKVGKRLSNIGFYSSRSTAIHLLLMSYNGETMYSSLSALILLTFYTNTSIYIQPKINHFFLFEDAKSILENMESKYPNGRLWHLIQGKFKRMEGNLGDAVLLFTKAKEPVQIDDSKETVIDEENYFRNASINEFTQFRTFAIYETGWAHIYAGNYSQASEAFFCLESLSNWSRLFYHYIATCCMIAEGKYEKAALESRQMISMFEQKRKLGHRISSNEQYAESRVESWIETSKTRSSTLKETLQNVRNPIWELVYLWNGTCYWSCKVVEDIKKQTTDDPMLHLIMGVLHRDLDGNVQLAMEYFNLVLKSDAGWINPYAMYELAATQCTATAKNEYYQITIADWIQCIESYYQGHSQDKEWECRMQLRCQLLLESSSRL